MSSKLEAALAEFDKYIAELAERQSRSGVPKPKPPPKVEETTVKVGPDDPNYTKANKGRVKVRVRRPEAYEPSEEQIRREQARERRLLNPSRPTLPDGRRDVDEEAYWAAVDAEFAAPARPFALVVSAYDPIAKFEKEFDRD